LDSTIGARWIPVQRYVTSGNISLICLNKENSFLQSIPKFTSIPGRASTWVIFISVPSRRDQT
jgi:hypothetical protein